MCQHICSIEVSQKTKKKLLTKKAFLSRLVSSLSSVQWGRSSASPGNNSMFSSTAVLPSPNKVRKSAPSSGSFCHQAGRSTAAAVVADCLQERDVIMSMLSDHSEDSSCTIIEDSPAPRIFPRQLVARKGLLEGRDSGRSGRSMGGQGRGSGRSMGSGRSVASARSMGSQVLEARESGRSMGSGRSMNSQALNGNGRSSGRSCGSLGEGSKSQVRKEVTGSGRNSLAQVQVQAQVLEGRERVLLEGREGVLLQEGGVSPP